MNPAMMLLAQMARKPARSSSVDSASTASTAPSKRKKPAKARAKAKPKAKALLSVDLSKAVIKRLSKQAGAKRVSADAYEQVNEIYKGLVKELTSKAVIMMQHSRSKTITLSHVKQAGEGLSMRLRGDPSTDETEIPRTVFIRAVKKTTPIGTRLQAEAVAGMIVLVEARLVKRMRGAYGLRVHSGQQTLSKRDLLNVKTVCQGV